MSGWDLLKATGLLLYAASLYVFTWSFWRWRSSKPARWLLWYALVLWSGFCLGMCMEFSHVN